MNCGEKLKYENSLGFEMDVDFTWQRHKKKMFNNIKKHLLINLYTFPHLIVPQFFRNCSIAVSCIVPYSYRCFLALDYLKN